LWNQEDASFSHSTTGEMGSSLSSSMAGASSVHHHSQNKGGKGHSKGKKKKKPVAKGGSQAVLHLRIHDEDHLYKAYMSFLSNGGLFVETHKIYGLGQKVRLVVRMPDSDDKIVLSGAIAWITPQSIRSGKKKGVGVAFTDPKGAKLAKKIEHMLRYRISSDEPTYTM